MLALSPFIIFMVVYLIGSLIAGDFYELPLTVAFLIASAYAIGITKKIKLRERINIFSRGAGDENIMLMIWIFVLAGAFATTASMMGAIDANSYNFLPGGCYPPLQWASKIVRINDHLPQQAPGTFVPGAFSHFTSVFFSSGHQKTCKNHLQHKIILEFP